MSEDLTKLTMLLMGEAVATKSLLAVLIATHPKPAKLAAIWHGSKTQWIEEGEETHCLQHDSYRLGLLSAFGWTTQAIDEAAEGG